MFKSKLSAASFVRKSKLIVGLDLTATMSTTPMDNRAELDRMEREALRIITQTADYAVAYKFNHHILLPLGLFDRIPRLLKAVHDQGLLAIMDAKVNDIGDTNEWIARYYFDAGFDALIVNPLVGWEGGLQPVFEMARNRGRGIIMLCYMSHPGASQGYGLTVATDEKMKHHEPLYATFARRAKAWEADGVIVGATYPDKIREVKRILGDAVPIMSPGVGAQGGSAREAIQAGASYVIAVRSVINAPDPAATARALVEETR
ncbi:MAG: orotidine 5'-phosphate decarboxylase [Candidatus Thorarchaeota archaeon]|nr:orotidine 5'-phosphate decarboxylase [Candidatus Thorarchaeota archaeon]